MRYRYRYEEVQILLISLYARNFRCFWEIGRFEIVKFTNWKIAKKDSENSCNWKAPQVGAVGMRG